MPFSGGQYPDGEVSDRLDQERLRQAFRSIIEAIGEDPLREGLRDTPRRMAELYAELFSGIGRDPGEELSVSYQEGGEGDQGIVLLRDVSFFSLCEHHFLPFFGAAHIAYLPRGRVVGVSKLARVLETVARRPQLQERLTNQVADVLYERLRPEGVAVLVEAEHLCISMRGVKRPGSVVVTSAMRGEFSSNASRRAEVLALLRKG